MKNLNNTPLWDAKPTHAETYDKYAGPQRKIAKELIKFIGKASPQNILEPGCGTGYYTQLLQDKFPKSQITCIDLSPAALQVAREQITENNIAFTQGDIEKMQLGKYDMITANAVFQWVRDLPGWIDKVYNSLNPGGITAFSYFSSNTYQELSRVVKHVFGEEKNIISNQFHTADEIIDITDKFMSFSMKSADFTVEFDNLRELLLSIRHTGTRGRRDNASVWTKGKYKLMEEFYLSEFGGIKVTYNVILYKGVK